MPQKKKKKKKKKTSVNNEENAHELNAVPYLFGHLGAAQQCEKTTMYITILNMLCEQISKQFLI